MPVQAVCEKAYYMFKAGVRKFDGFARTMLEELGDEVRPYLKQIYQYAKMDETNWEWRMEFDNEETVYEYDLSKIKFEERADENKGKTLESQKKEVSLQKTI